MTQISHQLPTFLPEDSIFYSISCYLPWHYTFHKVHYCTNWQHLGSKWSVKATKLCLL